MTKKIAIIEGNHQGLVRLEDGVISGAAEGFAKCLATMAPDLSFHIIRPHFDKFDINQVQFDDCDGVVFTGSANRWSADEAQAAPAREVMAKAFDARRPVFGSCYGLQLAVTVLGGSNRAHKSATEFAIARNIAVNDDGRSHALYHAKPAQFDARAMHRDEVAKMPTGAVCLAYNDHSACQAMVYEQGDISFWGVQYHPELSFADIADYIEKNDVDSFSDAALFAENLGLENDLSTLLADFRNLARVPDRKDHHLYEKYQLTASLIEPKIHKCELHNFLQSLSHR